MSWSKVLASCALGAAAVLASVGPALAAATPAAPGLKAAAAVVIDADSGQVLFGKNPHQHRAMASTTKIMTSLLAVESGKLDQYVTISKRAASVGEATIYLKEGERLTLRDLTYAVLLSSANDASTAVAEFLGDGSESKFVDLMNKRAGELGLKDTHFSNPHGLPSDNHYSTAYDLAMLLRTATRLQDWNTIAETKMKKIPLQGKADGRTLKSHNKMLWLYPYATGGKTGYTVAAGRCFVGSARKNGRMVVEAALSSPNLWEDTQSLMSFGLEQFESVVVAKKGEVVGTVPIQSGYNRVVEVIAPRDVTVCLPRGQADKSSLQQVWQLPDELTAPVDENQPVGQLVIKQGDRVLQTVPLVAAQAVPVAVSPWENISSWFMPGVLAAAAVSLFRLQEIRRRRRANKRMRRLPPRNLNSLYVKKKAS